MKAQQVTVLLIGSPEGSVFFLEGLAESRFTQLLRQTAGLLWESIAFDLWGHDNPEREWDKLDNPIIEVDLDKLSTRLVEDIMEKEDVSAELAVCYFLIFTMDYLGYHI